MKIGVVIPCIKDKYTIDPEAILKFLVTNSKYHLCFIIDSDRHEMILALEDLQKLLRRNITILQKKGPVSNSEAIRTGVAVLYKREDINYIGYMNGSIIDSFYDMDKLVEAMLITEGISVVLGNKKKETPQNIDFLSPSRILKKITNMMGVHMSNLPLKEINSDAKLFSKSIIPILFNETFVSNKTMDIEILLRLKNFIGPKNMLNHLSVQSIKGTVKTNVRQFTTVHAIMRSLFIYGAEIGHNFKSKVRINTSYINNTRCEQQLNRALPVY